MFPPPRYNDVKWHWLLTEFGPVCASWFPSLQSWDISGHYLRADDYEKTKQLEYLEPVALPKRHGYGSLYI